MAFMHELRNAALATLCALRSTADELRRVSLREETKHLAETLKVEKQVDTSFDGFFRVVGESTVVCTLFVSTGKILLRYYLFYLIACSCIVVVGLTVYTQYRYVQHQYKCIQRQLETQPTAAKNSQHTEVDKSGDQEVERPRDAVVLRRRDFAGHDGKFNLALAGKFGLVNTRPLSTSVTSMEGYLSMTRPTDIDAVQKQLFDQLKGYKLKDS